MIRSFLSLQLSYFRKNRAAVSIMFALTLPILVASFSIGIDGARFLGKRAKLSDALSQGALAVALTGNDNSSDVDIARNEQLLKSYIDYYLPLDKIKNGSLKVSLRKQYDPDDSSRVLALDYIADAQIISNPIISSLEHGLPGFEKEVLIASDGSNGIVRKSIDETSVESDIVFAVDFSSSMLDPSSEPSLNRLQLLQKIILDLSQDIFRSQSKTKVGVVPFDVGIPIKMSKKNDAGGDSIGCVIPYKLKNKYNIDYNFWASKNVYAVSGGLTSEKQREWIYNSRLSYWSSILRRKVSDLVANGICIEMPEYPYYSCDTRELNMLSPENIMKVDSELAIAAEVMNNNMSIASDATVDYSGTLNSSFLFNDNTYTIFEAPFGPGSILSNTFKNMCVSGFSTNNTSNDINFYANNISKIKQNSQLIPLTSDIKQLESFSKTKVFNGAGTDTTAGLLTAAKVVSNGKNPQKLIIVITDGEDSAQLSQLSTRFHRDFKMCQKIIDGIKLHSVNTKSTKIYYISLSAQDNNEVRLQFWRDNCVGSDGVFTATDYSTLKNVIGSILQKSNIHFINK
ncbi:hypothetical protein HAY28_004501 [Salmonella enterica]|nr:hypothetical protein [Salmonella enterica]